MCSVLLLAKYYKSTYSLLKSNTQKWEKKQVVKFNCKYNKNAITTILAKPLS